MLKKWGIELQSAGMKIYFWCIGKAGSVTSQQLCNLGGTGIPAGGMPAAYVHAVLVVKQDDQVVVGQLPLVVSVCINVG